MLLELEPVCSWWCMSKTPPSNKIVGNIPSLNFIRVFVLNYFFMLLTIMQKFQLKSNLIDGNCHSWHICVYQHTHTQLNEAPGLGHFSTQGYTKYQNLCLSCFTQEDILIFLHWTLGKTSDLRGRPIFDPRKGI